MSTFQRYLLFQIPGWVLGAIVLFAFRNWIGLPLWASALLFTLYVAKDFALYPFLRVAYQPGARVGAEGLVGEIAKVSRDLRPEGYVRVRGELWKARLPSGSAPLEKGARVRVQAARGMVLMVAPDDGGPGDVCGKARS